MPNTCSDETTCDALFSQFFYKRGDINNKRPFFKKHFPNGNFLDKPECVSDFSNFPQSITIVNAESFITKCVAGPCLEIAKYEFY